LGGNSSFGSRLFGSSLGFNGRWICGDWNWVLIAHAIDSFD